jgi:hypothetical protein
MIRIALLAAAVLALAVILLGGLHMPNGAALCPPDLRQFGECD